jgi:hypothetical protein
MMQRKSLIPSLHGRDNCSHEYGVWGNLIFLSFQQVQEKRRLEPVSSVSQFRCSSEEVNILPFHAPPVRLLQ